MSNSSTSIKVFRWWLLFTFGFFFSVLFLAADVSVAVVLDDDNQDYRLTLTLNATRLDPNDHSIKSVLVTAQLLDSGNNPVDESDIPVRFMTNGSVFIENGNDDITVNTVDGVARVHLRPHDGEAVIRVRATLEANGGFQAESFVTFSAVAAGNTGEGTTSSPSNPSPPAAPQPQVDLGGILGILDANGNFISLGYPLALIGIGLLVVVGAILILRRLLSWMLKGSSTAEIGLFTRVHALLIGVIGAVVTRSWLRRVDEHEVTLHPLRRRILNILGVKGIVHLRELQRELGCSMSTLLWHLQVLEDFNYVKTIKHRQYMAYHLSEYRPTPDKLKVYFALLNDKSRKIIEFMLMEQRMVSTREIEQLTRMQRANIRYHLKKLSELGLVVQRKEFRPPRYAINPRYVDFVRLHLSPEDFQASTSFDDYEFDSMETASYTK